MQMIDASYSSLKDVFENYNEAIRTLTKNVYPFPIYEKDIKINNSDEKKNNNAALRNFAINSYGTSSEF